MLFLGALALCYLLHVPTAISGNSADNLHVESWVTITRCRASCMQQYVTSLPSDDACVENGECKQCWEVCEEVHDPKASGPCRTHQDTSCMGGCQTACDFTAAHIHDPPPAAWGFPSPPSVYPVSPSQLVITWPRPQHPLRNGTDNSAIFALFWKFDRQPEWRLAGVTGERWAAIEGSYTDYRGLAFLLLAVVPQGVVATAHPLLEEEPTNQTQPQLPSISPSLPVEMEVLVQKSGGVLSARLSWLALQEPLVFTKVVWGRVTCRAQPMLPQCDLPEATFLALVDGDQEVDLPGLTYNSQYWLELHTDADTHQRILFTTPWCSQPDPSFTRCDSDTSFESIQLPNLSSSPSVNRLPLYASLATCVLVGGVMVALTVVLIRRHAKLRELLSSKLEPIWNRTQGIRQSLRGRAYSLRDSFHDGTMGFRANLKRFSNKKHKPMRMKKRTSSGKSRASEFDVESSMMCAASQKSAVTSDCSVSSTYTCETVLSGVGSTPSGPSRQSAEGYLPPLKVADRGPLPPVPRPIVVCSPEAAPSDSQEHEYLELTNMNIYS